MLTSSFPPSIARYLCVANQQMPQAMPSLADEYSGIQIWEYYFPAKVISSYELPSHEIRQPLGC